MYKIVKVLPASVSKCPIYIVEKNGQHFFAKSVLKRLKHLYIDDTNRDRFIPKESFFLEKLQNTGITPSFVDTFETDDDVTVVMEYLDNDWIDLFDLCRKTIIEDNVRTILRNIVLSLKKISKCGIHYLDIKPENIMVNVVNNDVRIVDFEDAVYSDLKNPTVLYDIGTVGYKCPERNHGWYNVQESQVFSIGCLMLFCFVRRTIFSDLFGLDRVNCSEEAKDLMNKCLEQDPSKRIYIDDILWHSWFSD